MQRAKILTVVKAFPFSLSDADRLGSTDDMVWIPQWHPRKPCLYAVHGCNIKKRWD